MNRCGTHNRTLLLGLLIVSSALLIFSTAQAQGYEPVPRHFPAAAMRAAMVVTQAPALLINNAPDQLSPGSRIHDTSNRLIMSASITGQNLLVNYVREPNGMVSEVWILTPQEAAQTLPTQLPPQ